MKGLVDDLDGNELVLEKRVGHAADDSGLLEWQLVHELVLVDVLQPVHQFDVIAELVRLRCLLIRLISIQQSLNASKRRLLIL